ncbi:MAG: leucine-rich repeat protein, partial [Candidatus Bipolaricaulota bacterium]
LSSVAIPNSVELIGQAAFYKNDLTSVVVPNSVEVIGEGGFFDNAIISVEIGEGVDIASNSIEGNFKEAYEENNKAAGVYVREDTDSDWRKKE